MTRTPVVALAATAAAVLAAACLAAGAAVGSSLQLLPGTTPTVQGSTSTDGRYHLQLLDPVLSAGPADLRLAITDKDERRVTSLEVVHTKPLHLVVVSRDLRTYFHVHPTAQADGSWTAPVSLTPGPWHVVADFTPSGGTPTALAADLAVPGDYQPQPPNAAASIAQTGPYQVFGSGTLTAGEASALSFRVDLAGKPVTELEDYLGAAGHLVVLRDGDLAYQHSHGTVEPAGRLQFEVAAPTPGTYWMFLEFRHAGAVRLARFQVTALGDAAPVLGGHQHHH